MAIKKMRAKTRKGIKKRIRISNGGDKKIGKLICNRINDNHRLIKKSRSRKLKAKKNTVLPKALNKFKSVM
jgi:ribosomal protein L35